jgi:hypothetical protein
MIIINALIEEQSMQNRYLSSDDCLMIHLILKVYL